MAKKILKVESDFDLSLIGLACSIREYKLGHFISKALLQDFEKQEDLEWYHSKSNQNYSISNFKFQSEEDDRSTFLFSNRLSGAIYLPSIKDFDYILLWTPSLSTDKTNEILSILKNIPEILKASFLPLDWIKEKDRLNRFLY